MLCRRVLSHLSPSFGESVSNVDVTFEMIHLRASVVMATLLYEFLDQKSCGGLGFPQGRRSIESSSESKGRILFG